MINNILSDFFQCYDASGNVMNSVDIRVTNFYQIDDLDHSYSSFHDQLVEISDEQVIDKRISIPMPMSHDGYWTLYRGTYKIVSNFQIAIPKGYCGYIITNDVLTRNGIFIVPARFESGHYEGISATLINIGGRLKIKSGTRTHQLIMIADNLNNAGRNYNEKHIYKDDIGSINADTSSI